MVVLNGVNATVVGVGVFDVLICDVMVVMSFLIVIFVFDLFFCGNNNGLLFYIVFIKVASAASSRNVSNARASI